MTFQTCSIDGCPKPKKTRGMCEMHYYRWYRHGDTGPVEEQNVRDRRCSVEGCDLKNNANGLCNMHYMRVKRYGTLELKGYHSFAGINRKSDSELDYHGLHQRLRTRRGKADTYKCVDCGAPAKHWSYDNLDPSERFNDAGRLFYSTDMSHYQPRCVSCHHILDNARFRAESQGKE